MSRSRRKTPVRGVTTAASDKTDKVAAHRRLRRRIKQIVGADYNRPVLPHEKEVSNRWSTSKDGKVRCDPAVEPSVLRT